MIIFPLVTQLIGSIVAYVAFGMDYCKEAISMPVFSFFLTFCLFTVPSKSMLTLLNTAAIYVISGIKFSFFHSSFFLLLGIGNLLIAQNTQYLTDRILFVLEGSVILAIYTTIFLSLLLPKSK